MPMFAWLRHPRLADIVYQRTHQGTYRICNNNNINIYNNNNNNSNSNNNNIINIFPKTPTDQCTPVERTCISKLDFCITIYPADGRADSTAHYPTDFPADSSAHYPTDHATNHDRTNHNRSNHQRADDISVAISTAADTVLGVRLLWQRRWVGR